MAFNKKMIASFFGVLFLVISTLACYVSYTYTVLNSTLKSIEITCNTDITSKGLPTVYVSGKSDSKLNYKKAYKFTRKSETVFVCKFDDSLQPRGFRFYYEFPGEKVEIRDIALNAIKKTYHLDLNQKFNFENIKKANLKNQLVLEIKELNGYIESPKQFIYPSDFTKIYILILPILFIICLLSFIVYNLKRFNIKVLTLSEVTLVILILSIFLPAPIYNIALILTVFVNFRKVKFKSIFEQKINIIIISFFVLYLFNNLFFSEEGYKSMGTIERFLPFLIIPIIIPSIATRKLLGLFPVSAIVLGFGLLMTSIFDVYIYNNISFLSFNNFSKYIHPVYYSYLLFFSIIYIHYHYHAKLKLVIQLLLFVFLIFSGSKLVLIFTSLIVIIAMLKNKKVFIGFGVLIAIVILFGPLKNRFKTIFNPQDLSIIKEAHIDDNNDPRINGLTFRVILWREAFLTMSEMDYLVGKGVTKATDKQLQERMVNLGLINHQKFNPHNQYVDTFWRTGIIGLILLLLIPIYSLIWAIKSKDVVLVQFSVLMLVAMLTESIFGRVTGVYFFTLVIVLLMNSKPLNENSHHRD